jgi:EAL domain-containing protein (putative c-di-GMP-specific phosphodiesterase class I)
MALDGDELDIHFQVQKSVATGEIRGYEALVRWQHPERGNVSPAEFIPVAEENGLILRLGEWVLRHACAKAASWDPPYKVAVNVSPLQFAHSDLPRMILEILIETGLPASRLELELTETTIFADKERSLHILRQIKAMGVTIALDDFGTGYSSLETLRSFPFDKIKLDRSFVEQVERSEQTAAMVRAVLALGRSLKIPVLAEGIENTQQLSVLSVEGCDEVQGFLLGRPMPLSRIIDAGQIVLKADFEPGAVQVRARPGAPEAGVPHAIALKA